MTTTYDVKTQAYVMLGGTLISAIILWLSLLKSATLQTVGAPLFSSDRRFYLSSELKPDHVLYPVVSGMNKVKMRWMSPADQVRERLALTHRRAADIDYLLKQNDHELVVATLIRGQVELGQVANQVMELNDTQLAAQLLSDLKLFELKLSSVSTQVSPAYQATISQLQVENQANQASILTLATNSAQPQN